MARDLFERHAVIRLLAYAVTIIAVLYALSMLWGIVTHYDTIVLMLFLAWIIAFALQPLVGIIQRRGVPRWLAVTLIYLALFAVVAGGIVLTVFSIRSQVEHLALMVAGMFSPGNPASLDQRIIGFLQGLGVSPSDARAAVNQAGRQIQVMVGDLATRGIATAEIMVSQVATLIFNAMVVTILSFYMMLDGAELVERVIRRLPPAWVPDIRLFQQHVDTFFGGFLRAALVISLVYAALNWVVLAALGQPAAVLFAILAGVLLVVPWIGGVLAVIPPALLVFLDSPPPVALRNLVILVIVLVIAQFVTMQIVAPRVIGTYVGLHPLLVFAALLIGGREAGVWGILFAPPVAAVAVAMLDTFIERWQRTSAKYAGLYTGQSGAGEKAQADGEAEAAESGHLVKMPG